MKAAPRISRILTLLLAFGLVPSAVGRADDLQAYYARALGSPAISLEAAEYARSAQHVLVTGFANEIVFGYYRDHKDYLESLKVPHQQITVVNPPSLSSVESNAELIYNRVMSAYKVNGKRPVSLVGHSNGGVAGLLCILKHPELIRNGIVRDFTAIQSPLQGTPAKDAMARDLQFLDLNPLTAFVKSALSRGIDSYASVGDEYRKAFAELSNEDFELLSSRIFYVASHQEPDKVGPFLRKTVKSLKGISNDGIVPEYSMSWPGIGRLLGVIPDLDHLVPVTPHHGGGTSPAKAFTQALLEARAAAQARCPTSFSRLLAMTTRRETP